jgi:L-Ala-D/L-Glu epimerase
MRVERIVPWRREIAAPASDARNRWSERSGSLIVVEHEGVRGIGEASPLPGFVAAESGYGGEAAARRFAVETAVLDARARARGVSVAELLVARPAARVPINAVVHDAAGARAAVARGVRTLKVKAGPDDDIDAFAIGLPGVRLRVDANQTWPLAEVEARLAALAGGRVEYVEEPAADLAPRLRGRLPVPIALDESLARADRDEWLDRALASGAVAALVLKPTVLGGFAACAALARRARAYGVAAVVTHALEGPVAMAACAELARALAPEIAVGLDRHVVLDAWDVAVPQLAGDAVVAAPAAGLGLDIGALLARAAQKDSR